MYPWGMYPGMHASLYTVCRCVFLPAVRCAVLYVPYWTDVHGPVVQNDTLDRETDRCWDLLAGRREEENMPVSAVSLSSLGYYRLFHPVLTFLPVLTYCSPKIKPRLFTPLGTPNRVTETRRYYP